MFREPQLVAAIFTPQAGKDEAGPEAGPEVMSKGVAEALEETARFEAVTRKYQTQKKFFQNKPPSDDAYDEFMNTVAAKLQKSCNKVESMETALRQREHEKRTEWGMPADVEAAGMKGVADGLPALHAGAKHGDLLVVRRLIAGGEIDPGGKEPKNGVTPLWLAARYGQPQVLDYLMCTIGVDWKCVDTHGRNVVWAASFGGHRDAVKFLCETITAVKSSKTMRTIADAVDNHNETPLFVAAQYGHLEVVKYLVEECTVTIDTAREDGATPLFMAANNNHLEVVRYLVDECKADPKLSRFEGRQPCPGVGEYSTPLRIAHHNGHIEVVKFLMGK